MQAPRDAFYPPERSGIKAIKPGCQGVIQWPCFRAVQKDRDDRGIVDSQLGVPRYVVVSPQWSPQGLHDRSCKGATTVHLSFEVAGVGNCRAEVFKGRDEVDRGIFK